MIEGLISMMDCFLKFCLLFQTESFRFVNNNDGDYPIVIGAISVVMEFEECRGTANQLRNWRRLKKTLAQI